MRVRKSTTSILLLLAGSLAVQAANIPVPAIHPAANKDVVATTTTTGVAEVHTKAPHPDKVNKEPGSVDAPVDGLDGKPHTGPGLFETKGKGTGSVGISSGNLHVDLKKPPPHTGDHEIVGLEEKEGDKVPKEAPIDKLTEAAPVSSSSSDDEPPKPAGGPVPEREHKSYVQPGTDTLKDPPVDAPAHLTPIDAGTDAGITQPMHSFALSFLMIIMSEIGDKTFLIAALMAMKHSRLVVFSAAFASLVIMSMLSAILGHAVPTLIPKAWTAFLAGGLFLVFGVKMLKEGLEMEKGNAEVLEEMAEVEAELQEKSRDRSSSLSRKLESGTMRSNTLRRNTSSPALSEEDEDDYESARGTKKGKKGGLLEGIQNLAGLVLSPAWVQTFVMTFLGEWGDRSQIATIAMAAGQDYWYVTVGTIAGHSICTGIAVIGGRMLASKISVRTVTLGGAVAFLVFGVIYLAESLYF
ncbi:hypothetical protein FPQ18DRAFT_51523 [Pyronema domesticum]|uniref:Similar to GCR1-dependent translation factor 1 acc. no. P38301 n=1 Tax=Pyronema omphalodes (strain CBS 100304) TaxID=1076935 RepID=U4LEZ6_PYROM|nr:hypothetical protein FPQ18DRAFT_51523 [Pyronema domesticum]CCX10017.1 Similar to GCR1-dependent translation factor 1; acc. no. P38301 [Pyronema omphalodes CBS 100304]